MAVFKCKMCGGALNVNNETVATCEYCGTQQTLPKCDDESITNLFNRANRLRMHCEFDKAEELYEKIINVDDTESEAHWGLVLCKYGIEYVEDPATYERIPTCHRASYFAITEDDDYLSAINNADSIRKELYEKEAKRIAELQKNILAKIQDEKPFDVFICYKETDETGERTPDSVMAEELYDALSDKGYRVFFSRITLEDKLGQEYEPYIFSALNSAKVMLVVGTKAEYMDAVWVRNEWSRYIKLTKNDHTKVLIPVYKQMDPYDMPEAFAHLQAQNMQKIGAIQDLVRGIGKIIKADKTENASNAYVLSSNNSALIDNAMSYLKDGNFAIAATTCDQVLKTDPEHSMAYVGKLMSELKIKEFSIKGFAFKKYIKNENYLKAMEYADEFVSEKFNGIAKYRKKRFKTFVLSVVAFAVLLPFLILGIIEMTYTTAKNEFNGTSPDYVKLSRKFEKLGGYKNSDYYYAICAVKNGSDSYFYSITEVEVVNETQLSELHHFPNLEKVSMSGNIESIPDNAFEGCSKLKEIIIPEGVTYIGDYAFSDCLNLTKIVIPNSVTYIGEYAFSGCLNLTNIVIPNSVETIGEYAFFRCEGITSVIIPNKVKIIGEYAFNGCSSLTSVTIPKSVKKMGSYVFSGCGDGLTIYCESTKKPDEWDLLWNLVYKVVWDYKG